MRVSPVCLRPSRLCALSRCFWADSWMLVATDVSSRSGAVGSWPSRTTTAKYLRTMPVTAVAAASDSVGGEVVGGEVVVGVEFGLLAVDDCDAAGSLPSPAQPPPATSRSAAVAQIVRLRTFVIPESCPFPQPSAWEGHERRCETTPSVGHAHSDTDSPFFAIGIPDE